MTMLPICMRPSSCSHHWTAERNAQKQSKSISVAIFCTANGQIIGRHEKTARETRLRICESKPPSRSKKVKRIGENGMRCNKVASHVFEGRVWGDRRARSVEMTLCRRFQRRWSKIGLDDLEPFYKIIQRETNITHGALSFSFRSFPRIQSTITSALRGT